MLVDAVQRVDGLTSGITSAPRAQPSERVPMNPPAGQPCSVTRHNSAMDEELDAASALQAQVQVVASSVRMCHLAHRARTAARQACRGAC